VTIMTITKILDLLSLRAREQPSTIAYSYLDNGEDEAARITYADLEQRALAVAELLRAYANPRDRVVLVYPSGLEFLGAFFGCLYARIVAVPLHSPRPGRHNDLVCPIFCTSWIVSVAQLLKYRDSCRMGRGEPNDECGLTVL